MNRSPVLLRAVAAVLVAGAVAACHRFDLRSLPEPEGVFRASLQRFRAGDYDHAQLGFQKLSFDMSPRDTLYPLVEFLLGESYFGQGDYITAARTFRRVADEHATSRLAPDALLRAGDSYAAQWAEPELDPTSGQTAMAVYQELQGRFPGSAAARIASARIRALNDEFARKEMANALFYYQRGAYDSAILYFKDLIASYPSAPLVPDAYAYLVKAYKAIGWKDEQGQFCDQIWQYYRQFYQHRADVRNICGDRTAGR